MASTPRTLALRLALWALASAGCTGEVKPLPAVTDGAVDLRFVPAAVHEEAQDLKVVRSKFIQPVGRFSGTLTVDGKTHRVSGIPGVVEDQDVVW